MLKLPSVIALEAEAPYNYSASVWTGNFSISFVGNLKTHHFHILSFPFLPLIMILLFYFIHIIYFRRRRKKNKINYYSFFFPFVLCSCSCSCCPSFLPLFFWLYNTIKKCARLVCMCNIYNLKVTKRKPVLLIDIKFCIKNKHSQKLFTINK